MNSSKHWRQSEAILNCKQETSDARPELHTLALSYSNLLSDSTVVPEVVLVTVHSSDAVIASEANVSRGVFPQSWATIFPQNSSHYGHWCLRTCFRRGHQNDDGPQTVSCDATQPPSPFWVCFSELQLQFLCTEMLLHFTADLMVFFSRSISTVSIVSTSKRRKSSRSCLVGHAADRAVVVDLDRTAVHTGVAAVAAAISPRTRHTPTPPMARLVDSVVHVS